MKSMLQMEILLLGFMQRLFSRVATSLMGSERPKC